MPSLPPCCQFYWDGDSHWEGDSVLSFFPPPKCWKLDYPIEVSRSGEVGSAGESCNTQYTHLGETWCVWGIVMVGGVLTETLPNPAEVCSQSDRSQPHMVGLRLCPAEESRERNTPH